MSVKKVTIEKKDSPPLSPNGEYLIRYRIISEDKNRTSHWSPIYRLDVSNLISAVTGTVLVNQDLITIAWEKASLKTSYDVFVRFNFDIQHKSLTDNVASIVTKNLTNISAGDTITVSGIDNTFNGVYEVTEVLPLTKTIKYKKVATNVDYSGANGSVTRGFLHQNTSSSVQVQTYSLLAVPGANFVEALVQLEGIEKTPSEILKIYQSPTPVAL
jgi:hypothetical protein